MSGVRAGSSQMSPRVVRTEQSAEELSRENGKLTQEPDAVAPFGHVRRGTASEVAVVEAGDLLLEEHTNTPFQMSSDRSQAVLERDLEQETDDQDDADDTHQAEPLVRSEHFASAE